MRLSFTARLALLAIALALVSNFASVLLIWTRIHDNAIEALRRDTVEQSQELVAVYRTGGLKPLRQAIGDAIDPDDDSLIVAIVDRNGRRLAGVGPDRLTIGPLAPTSFEIGVVGADKPWSQGEAGYSIHKAGRYWLVNGRLLDDWEQEQRAIEHAVVLSMLLALATGIVAGLLVTRYVGRRLNLIADVVESVGEGDFARRVAPVAGGADAFDRLAAQLNRMLDKIERLVGELRTVTDSLAHDLRSPIARLRAKTEAALLATDARQQEVALAGLLGETDLVMRMLTMLLEISRSEAVARDRFTRIEPAALVEEIAELYGPVVEEATMAFTLDIADRPPAMPMHRELVSQAITNLIDNALRHAGAGGALTLALESGGGQVRITVADRGPGIGPEDRDEALRRFGRLDRARSLPGAGLGLSLVDAVARLHHGRFELDDNRPGLVARLILPLV